MNQLTNQLINYTLHHADTLLILSQRNSEWCGHGPVLEQDIAITNISLDLLGQARNFYQYAAQLINESTNQPINQSTNQPSTEDALAYLRTEREFRNLLITELPKGDWARTILRQYLVSVYYSQLFDELKKSEDQQLSAIAEKSLKEVTYHVNWSREWVIRLADGTQESNQRMNQAIETLWPYSGEFFIPAEFEMDDNKFPDIIQLKEKWVQQVKETFDEAGLEWPEKVFMQSGGKKGVHTEHLGYILSEMQYLQRTYPHAEW